MGHPFDYSSHISDRSVRTTSIISFFLFSICSLNCKKEPPIVPPDKGQDTTSHNFTFTQFILGGKGGSSYFEDVTIVNDSVIYAVGTVFADDSTGQPDLQPYSVAIWNGSTWKLKKLFDNNNQLIPNLRGILAFNPSDVWLTDGGVYHWDGASDRMTTSFDRISLIGGVENGQSVDRLWGTNSNNLLGVGAKGMITRYDGTQWIKLPSKTNLDIHDIFGSTDASKGEQEIICVASDESVQPATSLMKIEDAQVTQIPLDSISADIRLWGTWYVAGKQYYVVGAANYANTTIDGSRLWYRLNEEMNQQWFTRGIRGVATNDIFTIGDNAEVFHYNGSTWFKYSNLYGLGSLRGIAFTKDFAVFVGIDIDGHALIIMGKRN